MSPSFRAYALPLASFATYRCTLWLSMLYEPMPTESGVGCVIRTWGSVTTKSPTIRRASRT
jgi:hypothetical protein